MLYSCFILVVHSLNYGGTLFVHIWDRKESSHIFVETCLMWHARNPCLISRWEGSVWLIRIYCTPHIQLESDSYYICFMYSTLLELHLLLVIFREYSIFAQHWGIQTIFVTHLRNKYEVPPRHPTLIVMALALFLLYFPCPSFMKHIDVSSQYFFLIVIIDELDSSLFMTACKIQFLFIDMYTYFFL